LVWYGVDSLSMENPAFSFPEAVCSDIKPV
jgi:hypothetical protein